MFQFFFCKIFHLFAFLVKDFSYAPATHREIRKRIAIQTTEQMQTPRMDVDVFLLLWEYHDRFPVVSYPVALKVGQLVVCRHSMPVGHRQMQPEFPVTVLRE